MVLIEWNSALSVDIKIIDEQHKKLIGYMNDLYDALTEKREPEIILQIFNNLEDYAKTHFCMEENCFKKFKYKDKNKHIPQHCVFRERIGQMKKQIISGNGDAEDLLEFLVDWLKHHIIKSDHEYVECFHKNGLR